VNVRRGDTVIVLAGKDRGKRGTIDRIQRTKRGIGVVVPGLNMAKRHQRPVRRPQQGGIIDLPVPIHVSNVQVVCPRCDRPTRIAHQQLDGGRRARVCKRCGEQIEVTVK
jgi:large subunit ribosomal protein L24